MAAPVTAINESLEGPERDAEIRRIIAEKREQIETLEEMLPFDPIVCSERVVFRVTVFLSEGDPLQRDRQRDLVHTALSLTKCVELVEVVSTDTPQRKAE
jgi:hypothetical protein